MGRRACRRSVGILVALLLGSGLAQSGWAKPPAWDLRIDKPKRFKVLKAFAREAVLDRETGLVWQRAPTDGSVIGTWSVLRLECLSRAIGGRTGWRLPLAYEVMSLFDPATGELPEGHPFDLQQSTGGFVTGTRLDPGEAVLVTRPPNPQAGFLPVDALAVVAVWCVRGPAGSAGHF